MPKDMIPVQVRLTEKTIEKVDELVDDEMYSTRSQAIRDAVRRLVMSPKRGGYWSQLTIDKILMPIIRNRVITEKELLKDGVTIIKLNLAYRHLVTAGFPIRKKLLLVERVKGSNKSGRTLTKHRIVIYYLEGEHG